MSRVLPWLLLLLAIPVGAAVNLPATCAKSAAVGTSSCGDAWYYKAPAGTTVQSAGKWVKFDSLPITAPVLVCKADIASGSTQCPKASQVSVPKSQLLPPPPPPTTSERITWDPPTRYVSGVPLSGNDPAYYNLKCGQASGGPYLSVQKVSRAITPPATRVGGYPPPTLGEWFCVVTAVSVGGRESAPSNEVSRQVIAAPVIQ